MNEDKIKMAIVGFNYSKINAEHAKGVKASKSIEVKHNISVTDVEESDISIGDGKQNIHKSLDMRQSGYGSNSQYMYFKAGVYNQNNSGDARDYVQATFYHLNNMHAGYGY